MLDSNHSAVLERAPPSLLKLLVDWPATGKRPKYQRGDGESSPFVLENHNNLVRPQRRLGGSATLGAEAVGELTSDRNTSAIPEYLSSSVCPRVCPAWKSSHRSSPSDLVLSRSKMGPQSRLVNYLHRHQAHLRTEHIVVNNVAIAHVLARFVVNVVDPKKALQSAQVARG